MNDEGINGDRVGGREFGVQSLGSNTPDFGPYCKINRLQGLFMRSQDTEREVLGARQGLESGVGGLESGVWSSGLERCPKAYPCDPGLQTPDPRLYLTNVIRPDCTIVLLAKWATTRYR